MPAIEITELTKDFQQGFWKRRRFRALDGLNLEVQQGEVFGLLGPNGSGKTTTQKLLLRLIFPSSGSMRILGRPVTDTSVHERIGYLPENPYFYDYLTAEEFLHYVGHLFSLTAEVRKTRVRTLLNQVKLGAERRFPLRKLSKGMLQRVGIAQSLMNDPELLFLDEPLSGLDPVGRREIRDLILRLKFQGKTVFLSTHILNDAEMICDRVAILHKGRLQDSGDLGELLKSGSSATEIVLENPPSSLVDELKPLARSRNQTEGRLWLEVARQENVPRVLDLARSRGTTILSLNPIKKSLEDFFMEKVAAQESVPKAGRQGQRNQS